MCCISSKRSIVLLKRNTRLKDFNSIQDCIVTNVLAIFGFISPSCLLSPHSSHSVLRAAFPLCCDSLNSSPCPAPVIRLWCHGTVETYSVGHSELIHPTPLLSFDERKSETNAYCFARACNARKETMQQCVNPIYNIIILFKSRGKKRDNPTDIRWKPSYKQSIVKT